MWFTLAEKKLTTPWSYINTLQSNAIKTFSTLNTSKQFLLMNQNTVQFTPKAIYFILTLNKKSILLYTTTGSKDLPRFKNPCYRRVTSLVTCASTCICLVCDLIYTEVTSQLGPAHGCPGPVLPQHPASGRGLHGCALCVSGAPPGL